MIKSILRISAVAIITFSILTFCFGCAGTTYEVKAMDLITATAIESQKSLDAFNASVIADNQAKKQAMIESIGELVAKAAAKTGLTPEQINELSIQTQAILLEKMSNIETQEKRRSLAYEVTSDNIKLIIETAAQVKRFSIYRADMGEQWKDQMLNMGSPKVWKGE